MKIALLGYGKMGKAVEKVALEKGHSCLIGLSDEADICIDFSSKNAVEQTARSILIPWVLGTTGWDHAQVLPIVKKRGVPLLYSSNFSIGMALFKSLLRLAKKLFSKHQLRGEELHHLHKKDAPSGTALELMEEFEGLSFSSKREGTHVGTHRLLFCSEDEEITLEHRALNREIFAKGALLGAEWLLKKKGIFKLEQVVGDLWNIQDLSQH